MKNDRSELIKLSIFCMFCFGEIFSECPTSAEKQVKYCPQSEEETNIAAAQSNCKAKCSTLKYHCLPDTQMINFFEVCAEEELIIGRVCAEYNTLGRRVQANRHNPKAVCAYINSNCPNVYKSTNTHKYKECFFSEKDSTIIPISTEKTDGLLISHTVIGILTAIVLIILVATGICVIKRRRGRVLNKREKNLNIIPLSKK